MNIGAFSSCLTFGRNKTEQRSVFKKIEETNNLNLERKWSSVNTSKEQDSSVYRHRRQELGEYVTQVFAA